MDIAKQPEGILEIAEEAVISVDPNQCIVLYNRGAEKTFGYVQAEVIGKPLDLLLPQWFANLSRAMGQRREVRCDPLLRSLQSASLRLLEKTILGIWFIGGA